MAYSTPPAFVAGNVLTAAQQNILGNDISFLANPPKCRVYNSVAINLVTSGTGQALTFDSERQDTDTMHSTVTNTHRITFTTAGFYLVGGQAEFAANATGWRALDLRLNGTTPIASDVQPTNSASVVTRLSVSTGYQFAAGDWIDLYAFQNSGGALNVSATPNASPEFWAVWVSL